MSGSRESSKEWAMFSDPRVSRRGWDAAVAGEKRNPPAAYDTVDAMAWLAGYDDAMAERDKDRPR